MRVCACVCVCVRVCVCVACVFKKDRKTVRVRVIEEIGNLKR